MSEALPLIDNLVSLTRSHPSAACESTQFYGTQLHVALHAAAEYLHGWALEHGYDPPVVALHEEFSWEDAGRDIAWQVTVILRDEDESS